MSGLFGIFRFDDAPVEPGSLEAMSHAMAYYGGDGGGIWLGQGIHSRVGLGSLLRSITPEDAFESQPLCVGGRTLVSTGRLDNREELCDAFSLALAEAAGIPDSALILRAHQRWGEGCVDHLLGDWSFALWDAEHQRVLLARDHHGNTAIYYHKDSHRLVFASSLKALLACPGTPRQPDLFKVAQVLVAWPGDGIRTAFEGIQALPPAHLLRVDGSGAKPRRYWFPETLPALGPSRDEDDLEQFREIYGRAIRARLRSAKPIGATLSAGLDSGSVVALAGPLLAAQNRPLTAFTAVPLFDEPSAWPAGSLGNEWELAHATALMAGVGLHLAVRAEHMGIQDSIRRQVELHDAPGHAGANYHWLLALLEEARARGLGALLVGQQGNGSISYSGRSSRWWPNLLSGEVKEAWRALRDSESNPWLAFQRQVLKPVLLPGIQAYRRVHAWRRPPWFAYSAIHPGLAQELNLAAEMAREGHDPAFIAAAEAPNLAALRLGRQGAGGLWHELGAGFGLEIRDPTADKRVIEFCLRCPDSLYRRKGQDRMLIRRAMAGRMPPEVLDTSARGLQSADLGRRVLSERQALEQDLKELARHRLASHCLDITRMSQVLARLTPETAHAARGDCGAVLIRGLGAGLFLQQF